MNALHIQRMVKRETGLDLPPNAIESAARKRMRQLHIRDLVSYLREIASDSREFDALIDLVVVPETWFFRDAEAFSVAARFALERRAVAGGPIRILSVPCASGEEPYSLVITLQTAGIPQEHFLIDAVDISPRLIRSAQQGIYKGNAFRGTQPGFRERYFIQHGDGFELSPDIRSRVRFRCDNLLTLEAHEGRPYDIIFCRNLLIYFDEATQAAAILKLRSLLHDDGMLFCGYAETTAFCLKDFTRAPYPNAFAVQKKSRAGPQNAAAGLSLPVRTIKPAARPLWTPPHTQGAAAPQPPSLPAPSTHKDVDALLAHANRMADEGAVKAASEAYLAYLDEVPDSAQAHFMLGLLHEHQQDDENAREFLRRAVYLDPNHYEALCHLALLSERRGDNARARHYRHRASRVFERRNGENER